MTATHTTGQITLPTAGPQRERLAEQRLELARAAAARGDRAEAAAILEASLRAGLWRYARLWLAFAALPPAPSDRQQLTALWLDVPKACRKMRSPITVLARASAIAGEHVEAQALLRKAILQLSRKRVPASLRLKRKLGLAATESRISPPALDAGEPAAAVTGELFGLYEALSTGSRRAAARHISALRAHGEADWLDRL
jgi:hypothetical protein